MLLVSASIWAFAYAMELVWVEVPAKLFWNKVQFLGSTTGPLGWLIFVLFRTNSQSWLTRQKLSRLVVVPVLTLVLVLTNELHGWVWRADTLVFVHDVATMEHTFGFWYWIHGAYGCALGLAASTVFVSWLRRRDRVIEPDVAIVLTVVPALPLVMLVLNFVLPREVLIIDWTPTAYAVAALSGAWSLTVLSVDSERALLSAVMENSLAQVAYLDTQFRVLQANASFAQAFAPGGENLVGRSYFDLLPGATDREVFERVRDTGQVVFRDAEPSHSPARPEDDATFWDWSLTPVLSSGGVVEGLVYSRVEVTALHSANQLLQETQDDLEDRVAQRTAELERTNASLRQQIAAREQVEAALRRSQAMLTEAQSIAHVGNWDWDIASGQLHWSDEVYRIFGLLPQQLGATYAAFLDAVHPDDRESVRQAVELALNEGSPYTIDHRIVLPDASERIVHERAQVLRDGSRPVRMVGTVQDVTELRRSERQLVRQAGELRILNEVGTAVSSSLTQEGVVNAALDGVSAALQSDLAVLFLLSEKGLRLQGISAHTPTQWSSVGGDHPLTECLCGLSLSSGEPVFSADILNDLRCTRRECQEAGLRAFAALPLLGREGTLGILAIGWVEPRLFDEQRTFLEALAAQVALGLQNALYYQSLQEQAQEQERSAHRVQALDRVALGLQSVLDASQVAPVLSSEMTKIGLSACLFLLDPTSNDLILRLPSTQAPIAGPVAGLLGEAVEMRRIPAGLSPFREVLATKRATSAQVLAAPSADVRARPAGVNVEQLLSLVGMSPSAKPILVPLLRVDEATGILMVWGESLADDDIPALSVLAAQIVSALERSELLMTLAETQALLETDRLRSELVARASHELRTPLGVIMMNATTLARSDVRFAREMRRVLLDGIIQEAAHLRALVDDLLEAGNLRDGMGRLALEPVDVVELSCAAVEGFPQTYGGHRIVCEFADGPLLALADPKRITQILRNLLDNAVKYSPSDSQITVSGRAEGPQVILSVRDQGVGIPARDRERIFERFVRVDNEYTRRRRGLGLGLAISRDLVALHGGEIWCSSTENQGSTFFFSLPSAGISGPQPDVGPVAEPQRELWSSVEAAGEGA